MLKKQTPLKLWRLSEHKPHASDVEYWEKYADENSTFPYCGRSETSWKWKHYLMCSNQKPRINHCCRNPLKQQAAAVHDHPTAHNAETQWSTVMSAMFSNSNWCDIWPLGTRMWDQQFFCHYLLYLQTWLNLSGTRKIFEEMRFIACTVEVNGIQTTWGFPNIIFGHKKRKCWNSKKCGEPEVT